MQIVSICQIMGWTYYEYEAQPDWFLCMLKDKLQIDTKRAKREIDSAKLKIHR